MTTNRLGQAEEILILEMPQMTASPGGFDITQVDLDRLVDGQLSADERERLLSRLDEVDGGWKQCALAFLEGQAWQQEFDRLVTRGPVAHPVRPRPRRELRVSNLASLAVVAVVAFLAGAWYPELPSVHEPNGVSSARRDRSAPPSPHLTPTASDSASWQLVVDGPQGNVALPVYSPEESVEAWQRMLAQPDSTAAGPERRDWYTVTLQDGRQVVVPIDQVEVSPDTFESLADIQ